MMVLTKERARRLLKRFMPVFIVAAIFYLFIYPFLIASKIIPPFIPAIIFGIFLYLQLLMLTLEFMYSTFAELYHLKRKDLFKFSVMEKGPLKTNENNLSNRRVVIIILSSYFFVVYSFAITYLFIGNYSTNSFDKPEISFVDSLFLSFTSISVGPSGIQPNSILTKLLVMSEIGVGLAYTILVFSLITSLIKKDTENKNSS